jgi:hypothetical protein
MHFLRIWVTPKRPRRSPLGKALIFVSDPQHCDLGIRVIDLLRKCTGLLGALAPMGWIA